MSLVTPGDPRGDRRHALGSPAVISINHGGTTTNANIVKSSGQLIAMEILAPSLLTDTVFNINFLSINGTEIGNKDGIAHNGTTWTLTVTDNIYIPPNSKIQVETATGQTDKAFEIVLVLK